MIFLLLIIPFAIAIAVIAGAWKEGGRRGTEAGIQDVMDGADDEYRELCDRAPGENRP